MIMMIKTILIYDYAGGILHCALTRRCNRNQRRRTEGLGGTSRKYLKITNETICAMVAELVATAIKPGQDPDDYFAEAIIKLAEVEAVGEPTSDRRLEDSLVQAVRQCTGASS